MKYIFFYALNYPAQEFHYFGRSEQERQEEVISVNDIEIVEEQIAKMHDVDASLVVITNIIKLPI